MQLDKASRACYYNGIYFMFAGASPQGVIMTKRVKIFVAIFVVIISIFAVLAMTTTAEEKTITVSFMKSHDTTSTTTTLDTVAHADGKITVKAGEKFVLPTSADDSYMGQEGYVLVWYTENGRTYEAGEEISFTEDTKLFRAVAKEVATIDELNDAMKNNSTCAILTADIETTSSISVKGEGQSVLILNGHTITITRSSNNVMGAQRSGKFIYGEGTINAYDTSSTLGQYYFFNCQSHSHNGTKNKTVVGADVTINAPDFKLFSDGDGAYNDGYPWLKIYGKINVYELGGVSHPNGNRYPRIQFFEGSELTVAGPYFVTDTYAYQSTIVSNVQGFQIAISGGTFNLPENATSIDYWTADYTDAIEYKGKVYPANRVDLKNMDKFEITGGSFNVKLPDEILKNGYKCIFNEETRRYDVEYVPCSAEGSGGTHNYTAQEAFRNYSATCDQIGIHYYRCECGSQYIDTVESSHSYTIIKIDTPATTTQSGVKRYTCAICADSYTESYTLDAAESEITLVVKTDNGTKEITVLLKDAYSITTSGNAVTFNGVASQIVVGEETYTKADIVKLVLPVGITNVAASAINGYTALEEIEIGEGANITFAQASIKACPNLKLLTAKGCTVIFQQYTVDSCASFATIDVTDANATFEKYSFCKNTAIKHILMASGHTYTFGEDAFRYSGLEEVILPDDSTVTVGKKSFAETTTIKYVYVGKNCIASKSFADQGSLFGGNSYLSKVVLMDIEYIGQWVFSTKAPGAAYGPLCDLTVYIHSDTIGFATSGSFNTRNGDYKVYVYMKATEYTGAPIAGDNNSATNNPNVVLYKGIPHAYTAQASSATCTTAGSTAYTIDCPCGVIESGRYTVEAYSAYTGDTAGATIDVGTVTEAKGHEFDVADGATIVTIIPATCATNEIVVYKCANCDETTSVETPNTLTSHIPSGEWQVLIQVTCTTDGVRQQLCTSCGDTAIVEVVPATGHTAGEEWTLVRDASCTLEKIEAKKCISCGEIVETKVTEANGHTAGDWTQMASANCIETGWQTQSCTVCNTVIDEKAIDALGHEFDIADGASVISIAYGDGFDKAGVVNTKCARCDEEQQGTVEAIFEALGYSVGPDGYSLKAGFMVNTEALNAYKALYPSFTFGIVMANANTVVSTQGFFTNGTLNASAKGFMISIESLKYVSWNADVAGFTADNAGSLELVVGIYTNDGEGNVSVIQYVDAEKYATTKTYADMSLNAITFNQVRVGHGMEALVPQSTLALTGDEE